MGIFSKKSGYLTSEVDSLGIIEDKVPSKPVKHNLSRGSSVKYGIDQAISLVNSLQEHKISPRVIAGIMKQTLESVEIHFTDIISDAQRKESLIQSETEKKDEQLRELTRKAEALKDEKIRLQKALNKTVYVREFLQQADLDEAPKVKVEASVANAGHGAGNQAVSR